MMLAEAPSVDVLEKGAKFLLNHKPLWPQNEDQGGGRHASQSIDFYHWYYGSLAMYMYAGPNSPNSHNQYWETWNKALKTTLLSHQNGPKEGHEHGSWDPFGGWSYKGGRVYATAINALTFEVYFRYQNTFGISGR